MMKTFFKTQLLLLCFLLLGSIVSQAQTQLGSDIDGEIAGDGSGNLALSADGMILATGGNSHNNNAGHVRIFEWNSNSSTWVKKGGDIDGVTANSYLGEAIALSSDGSIIAVGAKGYNSSIGHARVFEWNSGTSTWVQKGNELTGTGATDEFGTNVVLSTDGSILAIGSRNAAAGNGRGQVQIYEYNSGTNTWNLKGNAVEGVNDLDNAQHLSLSGNGLRLAVASANYPSLGNVGQVKIYNWNSGTSTWDLEHTQTGFGGNNQYWGLGVLSSDGERLAYSSVVPGGYTGQVKVYQRNGGTWTQLGSDINGDIAGDHSGNVRISSDGSRLIIGSPRNDNSSGNTNDNFGQTRIMEWDGANWVKISEVFGEGIGDYSGDKIGVSADGTRFAVGSLYNDGNGSDAGHVRAFTLMKDVSLDLSAICQSATSWNVPIKINADASLGAVSFKLDYDETVLTYTGDASTSYATMTTANDGLINHDAVNGTLTYSWVTASGSALSYTANSTLLELQFSVNATGAATPAFTWSTTAGDCELVDGSANLIYSDFITSSGTINASPAIGLTSDATNNTTCAGDNVTFTATNGVSYEFFIDNVSQGAASATATFSTTALTNGQVVKVIGTDANGCSGESTITITVNPLPTPTLSSDKTNDEICIGETITFTAGGALGGNLGSALNFVNSDKATGTNANLPQGNAARTIEAWFKTDPASSSNESVFDYGTKATNKRSGLMLTSDGRIDYVTDGANDVNGVSTVRDGNWHHVAVTHDGSSTKIYIDGVLEKTETRSYNTTGTGFSLGANTVGTELLDGTLDEVRVWNVARTVSEITNNMNNELTGSESGLVAYYNFNQGTAGGSNAGITTLNDGSSSAANGTMTGFALTGASSNWVGSQANVGSGTYQFFVNGASQGAASTTNTFSSSSLTNGQVVTVKAINANGCSATHGGITVIVNPLPTIGLTSDATANTICADDNVTFTATGGTSYEFFVNGASQGAASATATFSTTTLADGDVITVTGTDANTCSATSTGITMTVNPLPTPTLVSDKTGNTVCAGDAITFTGGGVPVNSFGGALDFDLSDNVTGTNANLPLGNNSRTVELWMKSDGFAFESLFQYGNNTVNGQYFNIAIAGGLIKFEGHFNDLHGTTTVQDGQWHHIAITHDGSTMILYVDGVVDASISKTLNTVNSSFSIGLINTLNADMDELRVWNVARTQTEITTNMNNALTGSETGLVAYYDFNQGVAGGNNAGLTTLIDKSPSGANGTLNGFTLTGATSNWDNGQTTPGAGTYQFFVNGASQGAASGTNTFASSSLSNTDVVTVKVTNANGCSATSTGITVTVNPLPTPTLASDDTDNKICTGGSVTFTATNADEYIFQVNGATVQAQSAIATFTTASLANNDVVSVIGVTTATGCQQASTTTFTMNVIDCYTYSGKIVYKNTVETYMGNVALTLTEQGTGTTFNATTSLVDGTFSFPNLYNGSTYSLAYSTGKSIGGFNSTDALKNILHSVGTSILNGLNVTAADVNNNGTVTAADALEIRRRYIGLTNSFPSGDWLFDDKTFTLSGADISNETIYALVYGDVNGSFVPNSTESENPTVFFIDGDEMAISNGDNIAIPIRMDVGMNIGAMSFMIFHQGMTINNITLSNGQNVMYSEDNGILKIAYADLAGLTLANDDVLFNIDATVTDADAMINQPMQLSAKTEIANNTAVPYAFVELKLPVFKTTITSINNLAVTALGLKAFPNPLSEKATISYNLPTSSQIIITVTNALGQKVRTLVNENQSAGEHQVEFIAAELPAGIYSYTVLVKNENIDYQVTNQLIIVK